MSTSLWILNHYAVPPDVPGGTRHYELGRQLLRLGHDVTIFASSFHHTRRCEAQRYEKASCQTETIEGIVFVWLRTFAYQRNDWRRFANMVSYMIRSYWWGRRLPRLDPSVPKPDVIIGSSVHLLAVVAAYLLARHYGAHFLMEVRDLWPQTLVEMGALAEHSLLTRLLQNLEKWLYIRAERIIVLLPRAADYIVNLGVEGGKVVWIPNGANLSQFPPRGSQGLTGGHFVVMYIGAHGQANALEILLDAAQLVQRRRQLAVRFVLIGDGPEKSKLIAQRDRLGLANTEFRDAIPKDQVPATLRDADLLVLLLRDLALYRYGVSLNKLFDYMAAGRPIIIAGRPANNVVEEAECGLSVPPEDPTALADAIIRLYRMTPAQRAEMGQRGRAYVAEHHDYSLLAQRLANLMKELDNDESF